MGSVKSLISRYEAPSSPNGEPPVRPPATPGNNHFSGLKLCVEFALVASVVSLISYFSAFKKLPLEIWISVILSVSFGIIASILCQINQTIRCVMALALAKMTAPEARVIMLSAITGLLIAGPCVSIAYNINQVRNSMECTSELVKTQALEMQNMYQGTFENMTNQVTKAVEVWKSLGSVVDSAISPVRDGLSMSIQEIANIRKSIDEVNHQCIGSIQKVQNDCSAGGLQAYRDCVSTVSRIPSISPGFKPVLSLVDQIPDFVKIPFGRRRRSALQDLQNICKPLDLSTDVCNSVLNPGKLCSPLRFAKRPIFNELDELMHKFFDVFQLSVTPKKDVVQAVNSSLGNISEVMSEVASEVKDKLVIAKLVSDNIQLSFSIILIFFPFVSSYLYLRRWRNISKSGSNAKIEKFFKKEQKKQRAGIRYHVVIFIIHLCLTVAVCAIDMLLFWAQDIMKNHGGVNFTASGSIDFRFDVEVGAVFQPLVEEFIHTLNEMQNYEFSLSSDSCLPNPMEPESHGLIVIMSVLYCLTLATFVTQFFTCIIHRKIVNVMDSEAKV